MKVLMAPMNMANMPQVLCEELRRKGIDAKFLQYIAHENNRYGYVVDERVNLFSEGKAYRAQLHTLKRHIEEDYDIFHFWNRSLLYHSQYSNFSGIDLVFLKNHGKKIIHRFTGFDLRRPSLDIELNPYSCFKFGYTHKYNEYRQQKYLDFISQYVDQFIVQDPEMHQFWPEAKIVPRALLVADWPFIGIKPSDNPLIVHAPSDAKAKGTNLILRALDQLSSEKIKFRFKLIEGMSHRQAIDWYKKADIIIDQILIGATGVLTLEAWALGKPVVVYLPDHLWKPFYGELPVANANPDNIKDVLKNLISDYEWRKHLSLLGRKTVEKHHDVSTVTDNLIGIYQDVLDQPPKTPESTTDIDYFLFQLNGAPTGPKPVRLSPLRNLILNISSYCSPMAPIFLKKLFFKPYNWFIKKL